MALDEVETIMSGYLEGTGFPANPHASGQGKAMTDASTGQRFGVKDVDGEMQILGAKVYRHSVDGAYNADWGIVALDQGRVTSVSFSRD